MQETRVIRKSFWIIGSGLASVALVAMVWSVLSDSDTHGTPPQLRPDSLELVNQGEQVYRENCAECHGQDLEGQPYWRQPDSDGYMPAPPHDESGHTWHHADRLLFEITKFGTAKIVGDDYKTRMPTYEGVLSDQEIIAVLSYIKSRWPKRVKQRHDRINGAQRDR